MLAFLLPLVLNVRRIVGAIFGWAIKHPVHVAFIALAAVAAFLALSNASLRGDIRHRDKIIALRDATIADMIASNEIATRLANENVQRVKQKYKEIADESEKDYANSLAANNAAIERWRLQNRRSRASQGDSTATTDVRTGIADTETLPVIPRGFVILPESDLDKVAVIQANLFALQEAARKVMAVDTVPE
jgi:hypothetical protein